MPSGAQDIGTWQTIFAIISVVAVVTNAGLICFTMDVLWDYSLQGRVWIFIGFQWVLIFVQFMMQAIIPDVPVEVQIQEQRIEFIQQKVIEKVEDEDYGVVYEITDDDDEEGADAVFGGKKGGCPCLHLSGKSQNRKINQDLEAIPVQPYPFGKVPAAWPEPLKSEGGGRWVQADGGATPTATPTKNPMTITGGAAQPTAAELAPGYNLNSYTSGYSAVPAAPTEVANPSAGYH